MTSLSRTTNSRQRHKRHNDGRVVRSGMSSSQQNIIIRPLLSTIFFALIVGNIILSSFQPFVDGSDLRRSFLHKKYNTRGSFCTPLQDQKRLSTTVLLDARRPSDSTSDPPDKKVTIYVSRGGNSKTTPLSFLKERPFISAIVITTIKAIAADLITQFILSSSKRNDHGGGTTIWDIRRTALFATFGLVYQGCVQYAIVNWGWERLFPGTSPRAVVSKVCGMNLVSDPFLFLPVFYVFKQSFIVGTVSWSVLKDALGSYRSNIWADVRNSWLVWFPGHAVTYGIMPPHCRIPWMAFLSFFYMCILSLTRGGGGAE